jgi:hypothetical protein
MKAEDLKLYPVNFRTYWQGRLEYLLEYEPERTRELFLDNRKKLYQEMKRAVQKAVLYEDKLEKNPNLEKDQVQEIVLASICPTDGEPREPLSEHLEMRIRDWAEDPPEGLADKRQMEIWYKAYQKKTETMS